jgi:hypothetical protein
MVASSGRPWMISHCKVRRRAGWEVGVEWDRRVQKLKLGLRWTVKGREEV